MNSHTVPQRLLRQFAYFDSATKSFRLWRYEKGKSPYPKASPKTATRYEGYFADNRNARLEIEVETRLAHEIEDPVNVFLDSLQNPSFTFTNTQREQMTRYITLLFSRCRARRSGSRHIQEIMAYALGRFVDSEVQPLTVAANWSMELYFKGKPTLIPPNYVREFAKNLLTHSRSSIAEQQNFVAGIRRAMDTFDTAMFHGTWNLVRTSPDEPFVLSDSPVVTWARHREAGISYGVGFRRPDAEVFLPVSPLTCLHVLPDVERTGPIAKPTVDEINAAQAKFAHRACYANHNNRRLQQLMQEHIATIQIGRDAFKLNHSNYDNLFYDILMGGSPLK